MKNGYKIIIAATSAYLVSLVATAIGVALYGIGGEGNPIIVGAYQQLGSFWFVFPIAFLAFLVALCILTSRIKKWTDKWLASNLAVWFLLLSLILAVNDTTTVLSGISPLDVVGFSYPSLIFILTLAFILLSVVFRFKKIKNLDF